ncbi:hypothetical protein NAC44_17615 [Allorhizobium sp. BGMRC 0089]|nr:hypothetical protein [Allorhizobium sonneratiae]
MEFIPEQVPDTAKASDDKNIKRIIEIRMCFRVNENLISLSIAHLKHDKILELLVEENFIFSEGPGVVVRCRKPFFPTKDDIPCIGPAAMKASIALFSFYAK